MNKLSSGISKKIKIEWVEDVYAGLQQGQRARGKEGCRCFKQEIQGEQSENKCAVSVTRTVKGLEFCCFKPSCQLGSGIVGGGDGWLRASQPDADANEQPQRSKYVLSESALPAGATNEIPEHSLAWLQQFSIGFVDIARYGIAVTPADSCGLYFPIRDLTGSFVGYARRQVAVPAGRGDGRGTDPKWVNHCPAGTLFVARPFRVGKPLVVVEDILSAIRVGKFTNSAALLGSTVNKHHVNNLISLFNKIKPSSIIIALDPDANDKAKKMKGVLTGLWTGVKVLKTTADPKWWSDEQIKEVLDNV